MGKLDGVDHWDVTYKRWYSALGQTLLSFPELIRKEDNPSSAMAASAISKKNSGWYWIRVLIFLLMIDSVILCLGVEASVSQMPKSRRQNDYWYQVWEGE